MKKLWNQFLCIFGYHSYSTTQKLSEYAIEIKCTDCSAIWLMYHPTETIANWTKNLKELKISPLPGKKAK